MNMTNINNELNAVTNLLHGLINTGERFNTITVSRATLTQLYTVVAVCSAELQTGRELVSRDGGE
jgi:regulator of PEP synthase PpsR (kinase-PPPase family)